MVEEPKPGGGWEPGARDIRWLPWLHLASKGMDAELVNLVLDAHASAALFNRQNASSQIFAAASLGSSDFAKGAIAALASIGGAHAPFTAARRIIYRADLDEVDAAIRAKRVPGWGNSFHKDGVDPSWANVASYLEQRYPEDHSAIELVTRRLGESREDGKTIYPNAAAFTAAASEILGLPWGTEPLLMLAGRLPVWALAWK